MVDVIALDRSNIEDEHICCAFSDKKCAQGYQAKKDWLTQQFEQGYHFDRLDARAKVFLEYGPAEQAWWPVEAPHALALNCFWVSGRYKQQGYAKALLERAKAAAKAEGRDALVTVAGQKKFHFMSDGRWLKRQGFVVVDQTDDGFELLQLALNDRAGESRFADCVQQKQGLAQQGLVVYYSHRCPFTDFHVNQELPATAAKRGLPLTIVHLNSLEKARSAPTPATIFSLFYQGKFITTDLSACMDSRFDKVTKIT
ncbi:GNAT family acetyltransferase [Bacterioplanes sanyensis]|uniref:GNAT family N-acetyltransferase n=1 Tax=Bacterioplanes sanyensis TaxID=1249553 RepID=UPI001679ECF9|nr:GNAT family N-acetyltransferase [Bacterioplanes sanyensis]GGY44572.1 GNAT family acetyltransferase [Bacterioplanes sanyensis]